MSMKPILAQVAARIKGQAVMSAKAKQALQQFIEDFPYKLVPVKLIGPSLNDKGYQAHAFQMTRSQAGGIDHFLRDQGFKLTFKNTKQGFYCWEKLVTGDGSKVGPISGEVYVEYVDDFNFLFVSIAG